ncbi:GIN domain-containing protein [Sphingomonas aerolata]|uniref:GIN domain-containing protein n=1 Tax=Sphingomonas aerolata TaxID=185951 RepID=UPI002FE392DA
MVRSTCASSRDRPARRSRGSARDRGGRDPRRRRDAVGPAEHEPLGRAPRDGGAAPGHRDAVHPASCLCQRRGGGRLTIDRMKGLRLDLAVSGAGSLAVNDAQADQLNATVIGTGRMTLAGRSARARLTVSGPGLIDATALAVDDLVVMQDGVGETRASARRTAQVTNGGAGSVTVAGTAACTVRAAATGPVICGR